MENEILKNIKTRRSIRKYSDKKIEENIVNKIIEAGTYAPSGMNKQSAVIVRITNKEIREKLMKMNAKIMGNENIDPFYGAPELLIVLADKRVPTYLYDGSLVMANLMLAANSFGIGSCWVHRAKEEFETEEGKEILKKIGLDENYEGIGHCILGYPLEVPNEKPRKEKYIYII